MKKKFVGILGICREEIPIWVPFDGNTIPKEAVRGGWTEDEGLFIGRARHNGSVTPGKIFQGSKLLSLPWGTLENLKTDFEILTCAGALNWVAASDGHVPQNAFPGGRSENGETLFIGRYLHNGIVSVGKIQPSHRVCYVTHEGKEINFNRYEVLVV